MKTTKKTTQTKGRQPQSEIKKVAAQAIVVRTKKGRTPSTKKTEGSSSRLESTLQLAQSQLSRMNLKEKMVSALSGTNIEATVGQQLSSLRTLVGEAAQKIQVKRPSAIMDLKKLKKQLIRTAKDAKKAALSSTKKASKKAQKKMRLDTKNARRAGTIVGLALFMVVSLLIGRQALADNSSSLDSLGDQSKIMQKASPSVPANTYRVVQRRVIDREYRSEIGINMGMVAAGGDSYYQTSNLGLQYDFHLGNRVSLGLRYAKNFNELTPEGKRIFDRAKAMEEAGNSNYSVPDLDQPLSTALATISFYPLYGKVSWFESTVSYFDFYLMAGGGQMELKNGSSGVGTAGLGMGMWWNQLLTTRLEARYQNYKDQISTGSRTIEGVVATLTMGILL